LAEEASREIRIMKGK